MVKNQPTIDAFMDRRWSSEYHFLSKLNNKLLHKPTNDVVNFCGRGCVSVLVLGGNLPSTERGRESFSTFVKISIEELEREHDE